MTKEVEIIERCESTLKIKPSTRERLANAGTKRDSYDDIINKLLDHYHNFIIKPNTIKVVAGKEGKK